MLGQVMKIIEMFIVGSFDDGSFVQSIFEPTPGKCIPQVYGKLREVAWKQLDVLLEKETAEVAYASRSFFIKEVDEKILDKVKLELNDFYKALLSEGKLALPEQIAEFHKVVQDCDFKEDLFSCIASWYVESEMAIDTLCRISLYNLIDEKVEPSLAFKIQEIWELSSDASTYSQYFLRVFCYLGTQMTPKMFKMFMKFPTATLVSKLTFMFGVRFMLGMPLFSAATTSTLGLISVPAICAFIMNKINDYKKKREVQLCFDTFKQITSNLTWDNDDLNALIHQAYFFRFQDTDDETLAQAVNSALSKRVHELLDGVDKYKEGTVVKQFSYEDEMLNRIILKEIQISRHEGLDVSAIDDWVLVEVLTEPQHIDFDMMSFIEDAESDEEEQATSPPHGEIRRESVKMKKMLEDEEKAKNANHWWPFGS